MQLCLHFLGAVSTAAALGLGATVTASFSLMLLSTRVTVKCKPLLRTLGLDPECWEGFGRKKDMFPLTVGMASFGAGLGPGNGTTSVIFGAAQ